MIYLTSLDQFYAFKSNPTNTLSEVIHYLENHECPLELIFDDNESNTVVIVEPDDMLSEFSYQGLTFMQLLKRHEFIDFSDGYSFIYLVTQTDGGILIIIPNGCLDNIITLNPSPYR